MVFTQDEPLSIALHPRHGNEFTFCCGATIRAHRGGDIVGKTDCSVIAVDLNNGVRDLNLPLGRIAKNVLIECANRISPDDALGAARYVEGVIRKKRHDRVEITLVIGLSMLRHDRSELRFGVSPSEDGTTQPHDDKQAQFQIDHDRMTPLSVRATACDGTMTPQLSWSLLHRGRFVHEY